MGIKWVFHVWTLEDVFKCNWSTLSLMNLFSVTNSVCSPLLSVNRLAVAIKSIHWHVEDFKTFAATYVTPILSLQPSECLSVQRWKCDEIKARFLTFCLERPFVLIGCFSLRPVIAALGRTLDSTLAPMDWSNINIAAHTHEVTDKNSP